LGHILSFFLADVDGCPVFVGAFITHLVWLTENCFSWFEETDRKSYCQGSVFNRDRLKTTSLNPSAKIQSAGYFADRM